MTRYLVAITWNKISDTLRSLSTLSAFKKAVQQLRFQLILYHIYLLDRINTVLVTRMKLNQWKNTKAVLARFTGIQHKELHSFITFDVVKFYPSISIDLPGAALEFATMNGILSFRQKRQQLQLW